MSKETGNNREVNKVSVANTIWKYELRIDDYQIIDLPLNSEILKFDMQGDVPCIWVMLPDPNSEHYEVESRKFRIFGTGHIGIKEEMNKENYIGTAMHRQGGLVWHLFEIPLQ